MTVHVEYRDAAGRKDEQLDFRCPVENGYLGTFLLLVSFDD
jgi:hypothetical protein